MGGRGRGRPKGSRKVSKAQGKSIAKCAVCSLTIIKARMYDDSSCYLYIFLESSITIILTYYVCLIVAPPEGLEKVSPWTQ